MDVIKDLGLDQLTLENIGVWPQPVKIAVYVGVFLLTLLLGYYFDISNRMDDLKLLQTKEVELKAKYEQMNLQASNLNAYKTQLQEMNALFNSMVKRLPSSSEVPGLLEDISKSGIASGLEFKLFVPLPEKQYDFFAELPIQITVVGSYHQLADFISKIENLDRIVLVQDFEIQRGKSDAAIGANTADVIANEGKLEMNLTATTYRYIEPTTNSKSPDEKVSSNAKP